MPRSEFLREADARGFVFQCTDMDGLDEALLAGPVAGYIGFDATADSLHVGSLVQIMSLRLMQRHGLKPVALMGGGTSRVGDPSFRDEARGLLTDAQIEANLAGIRRCFAHFSVSRMLSFDSVRTRLEREQGLTFLEFNYSILQSYDFRELSRRYGVALQMGGSDQWGNIVSGVELVRRTDQRAVFGLTTPLIATASGAKMGKTAKGAVWLTADRLSPYDYWQFWRNTEDGDVGRFLRLFTDLPLDEISRLERLAGAEINEAKKILAHEATSLAHGAEAAALAGDTARRAFEEGEAAESLPSITVPAAELAAGVPLFRLLVQAGLCATGGEARRLIRGGGARVNDAAAADEKRVVTEADVRTGAIKLSAGRKQHVLVRVG
jgi:tyrosyl-tRNA synthetase